MTDGWEELARPEESLALIHHKGPSLLELGNGLNLSAEQLNYSQCPKRAEKSLNLPQILLSSLHVSHCPKHPITSPACTQHFQHKSHQFLTCFLLCHFAELFLPTWQRSVCKNQTHPQFWDSSVSQPVQGHCFYHTGILQPHHNEKQDGLRKSRLGTCGICLCQSTAIIGPRFREGKEITYLQKHLSNQ